MIKTLQATNSLGGIFRFGKLNRLTSGLDLSGLNAIVNFSAGSGAGSNYQNTRIDNREFDLEFKMMRSGYEETQMDDKRGTLYTVFNPELNPIRLDFTMSDDRSFYLMANITSTPIIPPDKQNNNNVWQRVLLQFLATDPFIYETDVRKVDVASWIGLFEFPFETTEEDGFEVGTRTESDFVNVYNHGKNRTGMTLRLTATATVTGPTLTNITTQKELKLNFSMTKGDFIEVTTGQGDKKIILTRDAVQIDIFNSLDLYSDFLQLEQGDNMFKYGADAGKDNLEVSIIYRAKSVGV